MNNDTFYFQQEQRLNGVIDVLLRENARLKQLLAAYLPKGKGLSEAETELAMMMVGNFYSQNLHQQLPEGNNEMNISFPEIMEGNSSINNSHHQPMVGNNAIYISNQHQMEGNSQDYNSNHKLQEGNNEQQMVVVQANVRLLMKKAILASHVTTSKILIQLRTNPATPLSELRKLTGLTDDGLAKRIMAMKKAGLIMRASAPLRYLLTDKAKELFIEKRR